MNPVGDLQFATAADGARLAWRAEGPADASPILFSHSLGVTMDTWGPQIDGLRDAFRLVRYDARGHGRSDAPAGDYTVALLAGDALAVMDAAGVSAAHFVGLSMGGMAGMWIAIHAPQRLRRLVLVNTTAHIPLPPARWNQQIATAAAQGMGPIAGPTIDRWLGAAFKSQRPGDRDTIVATMQGMAPTGYAGCAAALRDADQRGELGRIAAPTLVITGDSDAATPPAAAEALAAAIPGARVEVVAGAGHLCNVEQPDGLNRLLRAFLD